MLNWPIPEDRLSQVSVHRQPERDGVPGPEEQRVRFEGWRAVDNRRPKQPYKATPTSTRILVRSV